MARQGAGRLDEEYEPEDDRPRRRDADVEADLDPEAEAELRARREARAERRAAGEANRSRLRAEAKAAIDRAGDDRPRAESGPVAARDRAPLVPRKLPDPKRHLSDVLGAGAGGRAWRDLNQAAEHLDQGRAGAARPIAQRLYARAPEVVEVAEVWGLTLYGLGRWEEAIDVLEGVRESTGLADNNPVLADAHRALRHWNDVEALWEELRETSPASAIMTEGRIVAAGALADQGELASAVRLLAKGWKRPKRPYDHHLRRAYALADLYERSGERPRAKELFGWVAGHDPDYVDAADRSAG